MPISLIVRNTISIGDGNKIVGSFVTNPVDNTVLADTGSLVEGNYLFGFITTSSIAATVLLQHRDSLNASNIDAIKIIIAAAGTDYPLFPSKVYINKNERIRIVMSGGIIGEIQGSIFYIKVV